MGRYDETIYLRNDVGAIKQAIQAFVEAILVDMDTMTSFKVHLVLTELLSNAYIHGNERNPDRPLIFRYCLEQGLLVMEITSGGSGFDTANSRRESLWGDETGRGIDLVNRIADSVSYLDSGRTVRVEIRVMQGPIV